MERGNLLITWGSLTSKLQHEIFYVHAHVLAHPPWKKHAHLPNQCLFPHMRLPFVIWPYLLWTYYWIFHRELGLLNKHSSWCCLLPNLYSTCLNIVLCVYVFNAVFKMKKQWKLLPYVSQWHMESWHVHIIVKMCCLIVCIVCLLSLLWMSPKKLCNMQYMQNR